MKILMLDSFDKVASLDVDAQQCFTSLCPDELPVNEGHLIVPELNAQAALAAFRLGSKDAHSPHAMWVNSNKKSTLHLHSEIDHYWPVHAVPGTPGFNALAGLPSPTEYDFFVWKGVELNLHPYGACYHDLQEKLSTGVIEFLKYHNVATVIVGGLATDYCVKTSVLQLLKAGFNVIVNLGACRGLTEATTNVAIREMQQQGAQMISSATLIKNVVNTVAV